MLLTAIGLGLDLAGAGILARGIAVSPRAIYARATQYWGFNPPAGAAGAQGRVDAEFGLGGLGLGIAFQLVGLATGQDGASALCVALAGVAAAAVLLLAWHLLRPRRVKALLLKIASLRESSDGITYETLPKPDGDRLMALGRAAGWPWEGSTESVENYVAREFGLERSDVTRSKES